MPSPRCCSCCAGPPFRGPGVLLPAARSQDPDAGSSRPADFTLPDLDGQPVTLGRFLGKEAVLLVFWATWCAECKAAIPEINALSTGPLAGKLRVLGLDFRESRETVVRAVKSHGIRYPVLLDLRDRWPTRTASPGFRRTSSSAGTGTSSTGISSSRQHRPVPVAPRKSLTAAARSPAGWCASGPAPAGPDRPSGASPALPACGSSTAPPAPRSRG